MCQGEKGGELRRKSVEILPRRFSSNVVRLRMARGV